MYDKSEVPDVYSSGFILYSIEYGHPFFLLILHRENREWGFPKGHLEEGETSIGAALRELHEETGVDSTYFITQSCIPYVIHYHANEHGVMVNKIVEFFSAQVATTQMPIRLDHDHTGYCWVHPLEAQYLLSRENHRALIDTVVLSLKDKK